jgi:hypothetical protein
MRNLCCFVLLMFCAARGYAQSNPYLLGWVGDDAKKSDVLGDIPKNTAENRTKEELKDPENEVVQAMLRADMPAMDRIFSDDWIIVDEEAQVRDKKAEFEPYKTGEEKVTAGRLDDMRVGLFACLSAPGDPDELPLRRPRSASISDRRSQPLSSRKELDRLRARAWRNDGRNSQCQPRR